LPESSVSSARRDGAGLGRVPQRQVGAADGLGGLPGGAFVVGDLEGELRGLPMPPADLPMIDVLERLVAR